MENQDQITRERRAILKSTEAIAELEKRRCALDEVRDDLAMSTRDAAHRHGELEDELSELDLRLRKKNQRQTEVDAEVQAIMAEVKSLEHQLKGRTRRVESLARKSESLASEINGQAGASSKVQETLQRIHDSVADMDAKLRFAQRKHSSLDTGD